jgi:Fur family ferric uptake transcriptional regulator
MILEKTMEEVRRLMREKELRLTPQRETVLRVLLDSSDQHPTAEEIYDLTRSMAPEIGLATIYRTLELFEDLGIVARLETGSGGRRYEVALDPDGHYHHHLLCLGCGTILEFNEDLLESLEAAVKRDSGFHVTDHSLRFFGYCADCQAKRKRGDESR